MIRNKVFDHRADLSNETPEGKIGLLSFTKGMHYIIDLTVYRYEYGNIKNTIKGYTLFLY